MALKTVQVPSNIVRPSRSNNFFSPSHASYQPKLPSRAEARIAAKKSLLVLKCSRDNQHDCVDDVVGSQPPDQTIPIVLYPSVVFPGETLQFQTVEFRYRIMMQTLLLEGLRFGIIYSGKKDVATADVGCIVHVVEYERLVDDRFFLTCTGGDRFRVVEVVRTKPYVVARIQVLSDIPGSEDRDHDLGRLMQQVDEHLKNVTLLSDKLNWSSRGDYQPGQLCVEQSPASFSFVVARLFVQDPSEQQWLLQLNDTAQRLAREGRYLEHRSKYLAAIAAIRDAFQHLSCNEN